MVGASTKRMRKFEHKKLGWVTLHMLLQPALLFQHRAGNGPVRAVIEK